MWRTVIAVAFVIVAPAVILLLGPDAGLPPEWIAGLGTVRLALDALALRLDGKAAAPNTIARKRAVFHAVLEYAVELKELDANPLYKVTWKPPKVTETVDPRVAVNPRQAQELLTMATYVGGRGRGRRLMALFACMYYAALRPAEAVGLRQGSGEPADRTRSPHDTPAA